MSNECAEHAWEAVEEQELADIRKQSRRGRPNMAWLEGVQRCAKCDGLEATVSWYGQVQRTSLSKSETGEIVLKWPSRAPAPGGGMSAG